MSNFCRAQVASSNRVSKLEVIFSAIFRLLCHRGFEHVWNLMKLGGDFQERELSSISARFVCVFAKPTKSRACLPPFAKPIKLPVPLFCQWLLVFLVAWLHAVDNKVRPRFF